MRCKVTAAPAPFSHTKNHKLCHLLQPHTHTQAQAHIPQMQGLISHITAQIPPWHAQARHVSVTMRPGVVQIHNGTALESVSWESQAEQSKNDLEQRV